MYTSIQLMFQIENLLESQTGHTTYYRFQPFIPHLKLLYGSRVHLHIDDSWCASPALDPSKGSLESRPELVRSSNCLSLTQEGLPNQVISRFRKKRGGRNAEGNKICSIYIKERKNIFKNEQRSKDAAAKKELIQVE